MKGIGIVGAGLIGTWHATRWEQLQNNWDGRLELVGFYDVSPAAAAKSAAEFGGQAFEKLDDLLRAVDVVDVCTPTPFHKEAVLAAAFAGVDIICEKPLARHLRDAAEMVTVCQAAGVRLFVAQVVRFFREFAQAKAILTSGALGHPGVIRTVRGGAPPFVPRLSSPPPGGTEGGDERRTWFTDFGQSGGVVMDVSIHDLDFARWCFGDVERVFARGLTFAGIGPYDHALITLRFKNGAIGHVEGSWAYPPGRFRTRLEITGDQGLVEWDSLGPTPLTLTLKPEEAPGSPGVPHPHSPLAPHDDPYLLELEHFLDCLERGVDFVVSPQDGLEAVRLSLAAIESIRTGQPIYLDEFKQDNH
jgi:UDP-N-acetylglucosamine 3-dehydrogenase